MRPVWKPGSKIKKMSPTVPKEHTVDKGVVTIAPVLTSRCDPFMYSSTCCQTCCVFLNIFMGCCLKIIDPTKCMIAIDFFTSHDQRCGLFAQIPNSWLWPYPKNYPRFSLGVLLMMSLCQDVAAKFLHEFFHSRQGDSVRRKFCPWMTQFWPLQNWGDK